MESVKAFNSELSSLYENKPPILKEKMNDLTKSALRAMNYYKLVVLSVETFIRKSKADYKIPGLYVIDSIVRQSRHNFGNNKDVFGPRFARNLSTTLEHVLQCPENEKQKVIRVLNLWLKNEVFPSDVVNPLLEIAAKQGPGGTSGAAEMKKRVFTPSGTSANADHLFECPVCMEIMAEPKVLYCGHSVCSSCMDKLIVGAFCHRETSH